jgi:hypothetical protein
VFSFTLLYGSFLYVFYLFICLLFVLYAKALPYCLVILGLFLLKFCLILCIFLYKRVHINYGVDYICSFVFAAVYFTGAACIMICCMLGFYFCSLSLTELLFTVSFSFYFIIMPLIFIGTRRFIAV